MTTRRIFSCPTPSSSRDSALQWAGDRSTGVPHSVVYLQPAAADDVTVRDQWEAYGSRVELRLERFRTLVDNLYEADTHSGSATFLTDTERRWIIEEALGRIDDPVHPLYTDGDPTAGLVEQAEELLTLLEFAGEITPEDVEQRLSREGLNELGKVLSQFVAQVHEVRKEGFAESKTFRSERFRHVLDAGTELVETELAAADVVVVGSFQTLSLQERDVVGLLADSFDTAVVLPHVTVTDDLHGADDAVGRLHEWYDDLGFTPPESPSESDPRSLRESAAAALYQHDDGTGESVTAGTNVTVETHATVGREVRSITRDVRSLIGDGVDPEEIVVTPVDEGTYSDRLADALRAADVPVTVDSSRSFFATTTGKLFEAAINLGTEPDRLEPLTRLLSNPLVVPEQRNAARAVLRNAELLESTRVSTLVEHVAEDEEALVRKVVTACERFVNAIDVDAGRQALFDELDVPTTGDGGGFTDAVGFSRHVKDRERQAVERASEVCASLTLRRNVANENGDADPDVEEVRRALDQVTIRVSVARDSDSVRVCQPTEAVANPVEYVFVPGLTTEHTPSPPRRLAFARPLNDAHPDFEAADPVANMRYVFAQLVASETTVTFSAPERNANGDPYVLADPLLELERVTGLNPDRADDSAAPATFTDVHRSIATAIDTEGLTPATVARNADTYDVAVPNVNASERLAAGVTVAAERAEDGVGEYDGHVDPAVVAELRDGGGPYSPSRLETFADCGFKYYLKYILKIEPDDEVTLEPNALDIGTYVHDVFERFYREWRAAGHEAVTNESIEEAETKLYTVATDRLTELDARETVFHDAWLAALFNGLRVTDNQFGDPDAAAGLFKRFLHAEVQLAPRDATPTYFEPHVGLTPDEPGPEVISRDPVRVPGTTVELRGKIDRLDITPDGGLVGLDYKTGSTPSEGDTIDGHAFQLPAYLLMAEDALGGEPVGASYYQVNPTSSISPHKGTIGGDEDAAHVYWGTDDPAPLRRSQSLAFDTRDEFTTFLHETVPDRIDRISTAVENGSFHPTVLDPQTAGCKYCPYRDACDVRHHRRHAIHQTLTEENTPQYAPGLDTEDDS